MRPVADRNQTVPTALAVHVLYRDDNHKNHLESPFLIRLLHSYTCTCTTVTVFVSKLIIQYKNTTVFEIVNRLSNKI